MCALSAVLPAQDSDSLPPSPANVGVVRPGDALRLAVYRITDLGGDYIIDSRGIVQIPGVGDIPVGGLDPVEVKEAIKQQLIARGFGDPELSVQVLLRVFVLGEVRQPGTLSVEPGTSLLQLLSLAGGPSDRADLEKAQVSRDGVAIKVDLRSALSGSVTGRYVLHSNDVMYIPKKGGLTRETLGLLLGSLSAVLAIANFIVVTNR
jgi:polysaccharide export outer membrane protein